MKSLFLIGILLFSGSVAVADAYQILDNTRQYHENLTKKEGALFFYGKKLPSDLSEEEAQQDLASGAYLVSIILKKSGVLDNLKRSAVSLDKELTAWPLAQAKEQLYPGCVLFWTSKAKKKEDKNGWQWNFLWGWSWDTIPAKEEPTRYRVGILFDDIEDGSPRVLQHLEGEGPELVPFRMGSWKFSHGRCYQ